jgi:hypothetical protein
MNRHLVLAIALGFAPIDTAEATPMRMATFEKVALSGSRLLVGSFSSLDPTCRSLGQFTISLIDPPHDGHVQVGQGEDFPNFSMFNVRARCNTRKRPATLIFYTATPGYTGPDEFSIELVDPRGNVGRARYRVTVR